MHMHTHGDAYENGTRLAMARSCVIWHTPHATILEDTYQMKKERHSACFQTTVWNKTSLDCHLLLHPLVFWLYTFGLSYTQCRSLYNSHYIYASATLLLHTTD
jgi:hypothetical protein